LAGTLEQANVRSEACQVGMPSAARGCAFVSADTGQQNRQIVPSSAREVQIVFQFRRFLTARRPTRERLNPRFAKIA